MAEVCQVIHCTQSEDQFETSYRHAEEGRRKPFENQREYGPVGPQLYHEILPSFMVLKSVFDLVKEFQTLRAPGSEGWGSSHGG